MPNDTCTIEGCAKPRKARGWCTMHYKRWVAHGNPLVVADRSLAWGTVEDRFWVKASPEDSQGCRLWTGTGNPGGYGQFSYYGKMYLAHRFIYEHTVGPIPNGLRLDHTCHNIDLSCPGGVTCKHRRCVTVSHLEPVTDAENSQRGRNSGSTHPNSLKTHCINGHPFNESNTRVSNGERVCKACKRDNSRNHRQSKQR
jgi:hypothetical protein